VKTMFRCVLRGCANTQDWEKRKQKNKKKKQKTKNKRERKKKKRALAGSLYIGFMALAVRCQWSLCGSRGVVGCVPTTGCVQKLWGDMQVMHVMCIQAVVIKTS